MGLFGNLFKSEFEKWVEGASHEELSCVYDVIHQHQYLVQISAQQ